MRQLVGIAVHLWSGARTPRENTALDGLATMQTGVAQAGFEDKLDGSVADARTISV